MYSAQITGVTLEPDYFDEENMEKLYVEEVAKEIAVLTQDWGPRDILADEDMVSSAEVLVILNVRWIAGPRSMPFVCY